MHTSAYRVVEPTEARPGRIGHGTPNRLELSPNRYWADPRWRGYGFGSSASAPGLACPLVEFVLTTTASRPTISSRASAMRSNTLKYGGGGASSLRRDG